MQRRMRRRPPPRSARDLLWGLSFVEAAALFLFTGLLLRIIWYLWGDRIRHTLARMYTTAHGISSHFLHSPRGMVITVIACTILLLAFHNHQLAREYRAQTTDLPRPQRNPTTPPRAPPRPRLPKPPPPPSALPRRELRGHSIRVKNRQKSPPSDRKKTAGGSGHPPPPVEQAPDAAVEPSVIHPLPMNKYPLPTGTDTDWPTCSPLDPPAHAREPNRGQRHWVFCHMPKTGGMTMRTVLERGARANKQHVAHLAKNYDTPGCARPAIGSRCNGVLGTQNLPQLRRAFGDDTHPTLLTMLRDPVERSYSAYHYVLRESNKPIHPLYKANTLEALLRGGLFYNDIGLGRNAYTRVLSDFLPDRALQCRELKNHTGRWSDRLEGHDYWNCLLAIAKTVLARHMHLVCVTERYEQCLELASRELFPDWLNRRHFSRIPHRNAARRPHLRSPRVTAMLREANHQDLELYSYASALFDCRWRRYLSAQAGVPELRAWGNNAHGVLGRGTSAVDMSTTTLATAPVVQVGGGGGVWDWAARNPSVCGSFALALVRNGTLYSAGWNRWNLLGRGGGGDSPRFAPVDLGNKRVSSFDAGHRHALAVVEPGGQVVGWGMNGYGQLGIGASSSSRGTLPALVHGLPAHDPVTQVAAGGRHSVAVTRSGQVWTWGLNDVGMLGIGLAGQHVTTPQRVKGLLEGQRVASVCAGTRHSAALTRTGEIYEWGWKACSRSQMRLCKIPYFRRTPLPEGGQQIVQLSCAGGANFALDAAGALFVWGTNAVAELGLGMPSVDGVGELVEEPRLVEGIPAMGHVQGSYDYTPGFHGGPTLAVTADQKQLWMWGPLVGGLDAVVAQSDRKAWLSLKKARMRCRNHNDGHLAEQLERCAKDLWTVVAPRPVRIALPKHQRTWTWATAGLANRGSAYFVTR